MATGVRITVYGAQAIAEAAKASLQGRTEIAEKIAEEARAAAPVLTGAYRDGIHAEVDGNNVRVVDDDEDAIYKEYGTSRTPAHATLTDAARKYGKYSGTQPRGRRRR